MDVLGWRSPAEGSGDFSHAHPLPPVRIPLPLEIVLIASPRPLGILVNVTSVTNRCEGDLLHRERRPFWAAFAFPTNTRSVFLQILARFSYIQPSSNPLTCAVPPWLPSPLRQFPAGAAFLMLGFIGASIRCRPVLCEPVSQEFGPDLLFRRVQ